MYNRKGYGGYLSSDGKNGRSGELFSSFKQKHLEKKAKNNNTTIVRSTKRKVIILVSFLYGGSTASLGERISQCVQHIWI